MKKLDLIVTILLIIGGINWGLVGFFQYDVIATLFGGIAPMVSKMIYGLVGLSGLFALYRVFNWKHEHSPWCGLVKQH